jgi:hypothetical protein
MVEFSVSLIDLRTIYIGSNWLFIMLRPYSVIPNPRRNGVE